MAPLAVEEGVVAVYAVIDGPFGRSDPLAEVVAAFLDRALDVGGEVLEDGDEEAVGEDVGVGVGGWLGSGGCGLGAGRRGDGFDACGGGVFAAVRGGVGGHDALVEVFLAGELVAGPEPFVELILIPLLEI